MPDLDVIASRDDLEGVGVGASVSPALFIAGFSLRSAQIQRVFALIELLRGVTAFLVAPVLVYLAATIGATKVAGLQTATWICCGIAAGGALAAVGLFILSRGRLQTPDLERWESGEPAWESGLLLARLRGLPAEDGEREAADDRVRTSVSDSEERAA